MRSSRSRCTTARAACRVRFSGVVVRDELDADEQPRAPDIADARVPGAHLAKIRQQPLAHDASMFLEFLLLEDIEDGQPCGARHRASAEGVEVLHAVGEGVGDRARGHDGAQREPVADRLAEADDVRHATGGRERPEVRADPAETDLHLVGDDHGTGGAGPLVGVRQETRPAG